MMASIPGLNPDKKPLSKDQVKDRLDTISKNGGWRHLKRDIILYNEMREQLILEMENHSDPVFQFVLSIYKSKMTQRDYEHNRLQIYAICNRHAMRNRLPVDEIMELDESDASELVPN